MFKATLFKVSLFKTSLFKTALFNVKTTSRSRLIAWPCQGFPTPHIKNKTAMRAHFLWLFWSMLLCLIMGSISLACRPSEKNRKPSEPTKLQSREKTPGGAPADWDATPSRERFLKQSGVNLPWISYGHDVGWPPKTGTWKQMGFRFFGPLIKHRASMNENMGAIRLWAFADNRSGFLGPHPHPGFSARCIQDMSAFMENTPADTTIIWVLYDYMIADGKGSEWGGRLGEARASLDGQKAWLTAWKRVEPCLSAIQKKYGHRIIWDIINEPLNGRRMVVRDADLDNMRGFVWAHMKELLAIGGRVSLGVRSLVTLRRVWAPIMQRAEQEIRKKGLPANHLVVQFHHYPGHELNEESAMQPLNIPALRKELNLSQKTPVVLGECRPTTGYQLADYFSKGFSGVLFWQDAKLKLPPDEIQKQIEYLKTHHGPKTTRQEHAKAIPAPKGPKSNPTPKHPKGNSAPKDPKGKAVSRNVEPMKDPLSSRPTEKKEAPSPSRPTKKKETPAPTQPITKREFVALDSCRSVVDGPGFGRKWFKKMGGGAHAFSDPVVGSDGALSFKMDVDAPRWSPENPFWSQKKRKGEILCAIRPHRKKEDRAHPKRGKESSGEKPTLTADLRNTTIEVVLTPPVEAVAHPWGSGAQIILQDNTGRRLHGHWTGLSKISGGKKQTLRFRPPENVVPGIGARQPGFRLDRVTDIGFLWATATFSTMKFSSTMKLHRIKITPLKKNDRASTTFLKWKNYWTYSTSGVNIHPVNKETDLSGCRFSRSSYPYFSGLSHVSSEDSLPWMERPTKKSTKGSDHLQAGEAGEAGDSTGKKPNTNNRVTLRIEMDHQDHFRQAGGISTDLSADCPGIGGAAMDLKGSVLRALVDFKNKSSSNDSAAEKAAEKATGEATGKTTGKAAGKAARKAADPSLVKIQVTLRDLDGKTCYSKNTAHPGKELTLELKNGPELCSAGRGVNLKKILKIGLVLTLDPELKSDFVETLSIDLLKISPP